MSQPYILITFLYYSDQSGIAICNNGLGRLIKKYKQILFIILNCIFYLNKIYFT